MRRLTNGWVAVVLGGARARSGRRGARPNAAPPCPCPAVPGLGVLFPASSAAYGPVDAAGPSNWSRRVPVVFSTKPDVALIAASRTALPSIVEHEKFVTVGPHKLRTKSHFFTRFMSVISRIGCTDSNGRRRCAPRQAHQRNHRQRSSSRPPAVESCDPSSLALRGLNQVQSHGTHRSRDDGIGLFPARNDGAHGNTSR